MAEFRRSDAGLKICFVCPAAYSLFAPESRQLFGGAEVRAWLFATGLTKEKNSPFEVSCIVARPTEPPRSEFDDIHLEFCDHLLDSKPALARLRRYLAFKETFPWLKIRKKTPGLLAALTTYLRVHSRQTLLSKLGASSLEAAMRKCRADVYCCFGVTQISARVVSQAKKMGKASLLFLTSDLDLSEFYSQAISWSHPWAKKHALGRAVLTRSDLKVVQTQHQQRILSEVFEQSSSLIRNPLPPIPNQDGRVMSSAAEPSVLWIGKLDDNKRPDRFLHLARSLPQLPFTMVINHETNNLLSELGQPLPANVSLHERLSFHQCQALFAQASVFVSTSRFEGFPNTFLQCGQWGVPIVSLDANPDGLFSSGSLGIVTHGCMNKLRSTVQEFSTGSVTAKNIGQNWKDYVGEYHSPEETAGALGRLLLFLR